MNNCIINQTKYSVVVSGMKGYTYSRTKKVHDDAKRKDNKTTLKARKLTSLICRNSPPPVLHTASDQKLEAGKAW